jgi:hypothetical protein
MGIFSYIHMPTCPIDIALLCFSSQAIIRLTVLFFHVSILKN